MKKRKVNKKTINNNKFMWILMASVIIMAFLIVTLAKSRDSRSRADDSVEAGVVLPVASDKE
ncbi:hypothetical protein CO009_03735 [Candidatus Shapirobacteria bacterium CG_4_8_14_3_um_filter_35_11]|uniref:Uncharacterized protein n=1 Tax=Candidatus Shapirobacteria bacterium CG_4_8_14_3_um_filter_35_11 TaxID=1974874 RepID=A0A2M8GIU4_9BACT|nr:MAG: hypothetical protein CO009_03735 [Candidatus Shapirobacteria bacterium CG_4_8_14_3_um_filter_35_11]